MSTKIARFNVDLSDTNLAVILAITIIASSGVMSTTFTREMRHELFSLSLTESSGDIYRGSNETTDMHTGIPCALR